MQQSKLLVVGGSIVGVFLLVYGSAFVYYLPTGNYYMEGGLMDSNYSFLALLCAVPFVLASLIRRGINPKKHVYSMLIGGFLFAVHFAFVHWLFVYSEIQLTEGTLLRTLIVLPISALLVIGAVRIGMNMKTAADET